MEKQLTLFGIEQQQQQQQQRSRREVFVIDGVWFIDFGNGDRLRLNRHNTSMLEILN